MAKALVIVESPAKAKTINKYLGSDYIVIASMGHVRDLPKSKLGVDVDDGFAAVYEPLATRKKVLAIAGVATLLVLLTGIRLWMGLYGTAALGWPWVKLACWLGLSALAGLGYRRRERAGLLMLIALVLATTALAMVYVKPF